jgi:hypothetical protein
MLRDAPMPRQQISSRECCSAATQVRFFSGICPRTVSFPIIQWNKIGSALTGPEVPGQVFCSFEASRAMVTRVGESVHEYLWCA